MAGRISGITIEIGGDTTKLQESLRGVDKELRNTQSALKDVNKLLKLDPGSTELLTQKQKDLEKAIGTTKTRLDELKKASQEAAKTKDNYSAWKSAFDPIQKEITETDEKSKKLREQLEKLEKAGKVDTEQYTKLQAELQETEAHAKSLREQAKQVSDEFGNPISPENWDALQREIIATEQDLQGLEQEYRNFGSVGAQQVAAVGQKMQDVGSAIEGAGQKLAPVSAAAAGLIGSLVGLGYSALTSADDLNTLAKQTGLSTDEIQKMQYAADLVDVSFSDIEGALKKMKSKMDPTNEAFQKLGVAVTDADGNMRSATDVFYDSIAALSQIENETERDQMAMELFGKSADSLAGIIDDGGAALKEYGQQAEDLGLILSQETLDDLNAMNDVVDTLKANFKGAFAKVGATLAKTFAPALQKAADFAQRLADKIANLSPKTLKLVTGIAGVVAAIAPVLIVGGKLIGGVGKVLTLAPKIVSGIKLVTTALGGALGPIALVIGAVVAVVAAIKHWDEIKEFVSNLVENIKGMWDNLKPMLAQAVENVKAAVVAKWEEIKASIAEKWEGIKADAAAKVEELKQNVVAKWEEIKSSVSTAVQNLKNAVIVKWLLLKMAVSQAIENLKSSAVEKWEEIKESVSEIVENVKSAVVDKWNELKSSVATAIQNLKNTLTVRWTLIKTSVSRIVDTLKSNVTNAWENAKSTVVDTVTGLKTSVVNLWNGIKTSVQSKVSTLVSSITGRFYNVKLTITNIFNGIRDAITSKIEEAKETVSGIWDTIVGFFTGDIKINFKLPKISLGEKVWDTFAGQIKIPWPQITWEKQGYTNPVMFTKPTVLATPNGNYGFGDGHGAEIVLGLNKLRELVGSSGNQVTINVYPPAGANVEQIAAAVEQRLVAAQQRRIRVYA